MKVGDFVRSHPIAATQDLYPTAPEEQSDIVIEIVQREGVIIESNADHDGISTFLVMWRDGTLNWVDAATIELAQSS